MGYINLFDFFVLCVQGGEGLKRIRGRGPPTRDQMAQRAGATGRASVRVCLAGYFPFFQTGILLSGGFCRGLGLLAGLRLCAGRFAGGFGGILQAINVCEAAAAFLDFIVLFTHRVSPFL